MQKTVSGYGRSDSNDVPYRSSNHRHNWLRRSPSGWWGSSVASCLTNFRVKASSLPRGVGGGEGGEAESCFRLSASQTPSNGSKHPSSKNASPSLVYWLHRWWLGSSVASYLTIYSVVTTWMGDRYVLGFAPAPRFIRSQSLCRLDKSPSDETVDRGPTCAHAFRKITYARTHARQRSCSPCQNSVDYGNIKIIQHALKSVRALFRVLKLDTARKKKRNVKTWTDFPSLTVSEWLTDTSVSRVCWDNNNNNRELIERFQKLKALYNWT